MTSKKVTFFDLILTDIEMPHINGMELAATIGRICQRAWSFSLPLIRNTHWMPFELSAFRYIDKEMIPEKLPTAIKDAFRVLHMQADQYYLLSNTRMYRKLLLKDILYISREGKNSVFQFNKPDRSKKNAKLIRWWKDWTVWFCFCWQRHHRKSDPYRLHSGHDDWIG